MRNYTKEQKQSVIDRYISGGESSVNILTNIKHFEKVRFVLEKVLEKSKKI